MNLVGQWPGAWNALRRLRIAQQGMEKTNAMRHKHLLFLITMAAAVLLSCTKSGGSMEPDRAYAMLGQVAERSADGDKRGALQLADSALAMNPPDSIRCHLLCEKTAALVDMGRMDDAISAGRGALKFAEKTNDVEAILNLRGALGIAYRRLGRPDSALVEYERGIELAVREANTEYEVYLDNCVTVLFCEDGRYDEAIQYARKAEAAARASGDTVEMLSARANIGSIYNRRQMYREAVDAVLPVWDDVLQMDYNVITLKYLSIILKSYSALGDSQAVDKYMEYADKAMQGVSPTSNGVLGILSVKADVLGRRGRYPEQLALIDSIIAQNSTNLMMPMERLLGERAVCLAQMGRGEEAFSTMKDAYDMLDSVKQSGIDKSMSEFAVKYRLLEKDLSIEHMEREKAELENGLLWLAIVVAMLVVAVCVMLYRRKIAAQRAELNERRSYISGLENERERLAKELHDGVCNDILATTLLLATNGPLAEEHLRKVWKDVRHLSHALMPPRFKAVTLAEAVRAYVDTISGDAGHEVKFEADESFDWRSLPQQEAYETYRIIQESVANALKYGDASTVRVALAVEDGKVVATVTNRCAGGDAQPPAAGIGQETMRRRAGSIGAELTVSSEGNAHTVRIMYKISSKRKGYDDSIG